MSFSTTDLDLHLEVASLEAIDEMIEEASSPQAPYDSATMGTHTHPSSEHLGSLDHYYYHYYSVAFCCTKSISVLFFALPPPPNFFENNKMNKIKCDARESNRSPLETDFIQQFYPCLVPHTSRFSFNSHVHCISCILILN